MRWAVLLALLPGVAAAQAPEVAWTGTYRCGQGITALSLTVVPASDGHATAIFHFGADRSNPGVPEGCFSMSGTYDARHLDLRAASWLLQPPGYVTVDLDGGVAPGGRSITGRVIGPNCTTFTLHRVKRDPALARCHGLIA